MPYNETMRHALESGCIGYFGDTRLIHKKWVKALAALVDQSWLSMLSFAVAMAFIREASKNEYALFILLQSAILMIQGVQNALFIAPQATIYPAALEARRWHVLNTSATGQSIFAVCAALFCAAGFPVYEQIVGQKHDLVMASAFAMAILGVASREGARAIHYVKGKAEQALTGDFIYGGVLLICLVLLLAMSAVTARNVLFSIGLAGVISLVNTGISGTKPILDRKILSEFWLCSRWSLPGTLVTWINLSSYPYVVIMILGAAAVADINTARLFLIPATLAVTAWSNLMRPKISALMAMNDTGAVRRLSLQSLLITEVGLGIFAICLVGGYPLLERLLGSKYQGLLPLVLAWVVFFALNMMRSIFMATLMSTPEGYRKIHHLSWLALALVIPGLLLLSHLGPIWVVAALCTVELILGGILAHLALILWKGEGRAPDQGWELNKMNRTGDKCEPIKPDAALNKPE